MAPIPPLYASITPDRQFPVVAHASPTSQDQTRWNVVPETTGDRGVLGRVALPTPSPARRSMLRDGSGEAGISPLGKPASLSEGGQVQQFRRPFRSALSARSEERRV